MAVHHSDAPQELDRLTRRIKTLETASPSNHTPDSFHPGTGADSVQVGEYASATGDYSVAIGAGQAVGESSTAVGDNSTATGEDSTAVGSQSIADHQGASAFGYRSFARHDYSTAVGANASTDNDNEVKLGSWEATVVVDGTFSNPSARRLKQNITPAPPLVDLFPNLVEYEYIAAAGIRRVGYIADEMVGTDAERFITYDDDGQIRGVSVLELLIAQVARLHARVTELENGG